ncbi:MAG: TonB family protein [Pseudomonadota bacterium]|nr:TonB family protein [Pseudomonadota bacterium]
MAMSPGRLRVLVALLASVALHSTLLAALRPGGALGATAARTYLLVRMLSARPDVVVAAAAATTAVTPEEASAAGSKSGTAERANPLTGPVPSRQAASAPTEPREMSPAARESESPAADWPSTPSSAASQREPGLRPAPAYLSGAHLDPGPAPLDDIEPVFPTEAGNQEGMVVLRILISEAGVVDDVAVIRSAPKGLFEHAAVVAFQNAKFSPGRVFGLPVKSQINIQVDFTPFNRGATVSGRGY